MTLISIIFLIFVVLGCSIGAETPTAGLERGKLRETIKKKRRPSGPPGSLSNF